MMAVTFPYFAGSIVQGQFIYYVSVISERFTEINHLFNKINQECDKKHAPIAVFDIESHNDIQKIKTKNLNLIATEQPLKEKSTQETASSSENTDDDSEAEGVIRQPIGFVLS